MYRSVVARLVWPASSLIAVALTPHMARCEQKVWRKTCHPISRSPARRQHRQSIVSIEGLTPDVRHELLAVAREMPSVADAHPSAQDFHRLQLHANLRRYRLALNVCQLLHRCLLPEERTGRWQFRSFAGDHREMGLLFEAFVRAFLKREQDGFDRVERTRIRWIVEGETNKLLPDMKTDITLRRPGQAVVLETKCYADALHIGAVRWRDSQVTRRVPARRLPRQLPLRW
jgi:hypothetical protein